MLASNILIKYWKAPQTPRCLRVSVTSLNCGCYATAACDTIGAACVKSHQPQPRNRKNRNGRTLIGLEAWAHAGVESYNREASLYKRMSLNQSSYSLAYLSIFEFLSFIFRQILKPVIGQGGWDCPMARCI